MSTNKKRGGEEAAAAPDPPDLSGDLAPWTLASVSHLVDGNKRLALAATIAFLGMNGIRLTLTNDEAYDLVIGVATATLDDVPGIAAVLESRSSSRVR